MIPSMHVFEASCRIALKLFPRSAYATSAVMSEKSDPTSTLEPPLTEMPNAVDRETVHYFVMRLVWRSDSSYIQQKRPKRWSGRTMGPVSKKPMDIKQAVKASVAAESQDSKLWGFVPNQCRTVWGPLVLILLPPYFVVFFWHILVELDGSVYAVVDKVTEGGLGYMWSIVPSPVDWEAWTLILSFG